jgi:hypothetical protein
MCDTDSMAIVSSEKGGLIPCKGGQYRTRRGKDAIKALPWKQAQEIVAEFQKLNPYDPKIVKGSILNIVQELNYHVDGRQRQLYGYGISAKRYGLYLQDESGFRLIKASEHGLGLYYRPKEGRDAECEVASWIKEGWEWMLRRALGMKTQRPSWFAMPVMRRIAISTPNVMATLRRLRRDHARPYNFALSPVLVNLTGAPVKLLAPFEKDSAQWMTMPHVNIRDGTTHILKEQSLPFIVQTFEMVFQQYHQHQESKSCAPDGTPCKPNTCSLLKRYPVTVTAFHLIGKETERGWEQSDDISTLMPSLVHYGRNNSAEHERVRQHLLKIPLAFLEQETGLSRHTILRARRGQRVHPRSLNLLSHVLRKVPGRH